MVQLLGCPSGEEAVRAPRSEDGIEREENEEK